MSFDDCGILLREYLRMCCETVPRSLRGWPTGSVRSSPKVARLHRRLKGEAAQKHQPYSLLVSGLALKPVRDSRNM